jgi:hypothetical protein
MFLHVAYSRRREKASPTSARLLGSRNIQVALNLAKVGLARLAVHAQLLDAGELARHRRGDVATVVGFALRHCCAAYALQSSFSVGQIADLPATRKEKSQRTPLTFVVQKRRASRLGDDFRLDGVMLT